MARTTIPVNRQKLVEIIAKLEGENQYTNRSTLFAAISQQYGDSRITPAIIYLRVREWGLTLQTPVGKRGRKLGEHKGIAIGKVARAEKFARNEGIKNALVELVKTTPQRFQPVGQRVDNGSKKAALQLKCFDCCDYQTTEVCHCPVVNCSLWAFRPYQKGVASNVSSLQGENDISPE